MSLKIYLPIIIAAIAVQGIMKNRYLSVDSVIVFILTEIATTLRTKKKVSAREMSLAIGQNPNYVNHIETGNAAPSLLGLSYICEYLGITMGEFFDFDSANPIKLSRINEYLKKLNDEQLEIVENLVKNMADK